jgi:hypothetical protein
MREELNLVNVIIYDGNRKVNWDFRDGKPLMEALGKFGFKWQKNSVRVNGHPVTDSLLYHNLGSFVEASKRCGDYSGKLFVTMEKHDNQQKKESE